MSRTPRPVAFHLRLAHGLGRLWNQFTLGKMHGLALMVTEPTGAFTRPTPCSTTQTFISTLLQMPTLLLEYLFYLMVRVALAAAFCPRDLRPVLLRLHTGRQIRTPFISVRSRIPGHRI